VRPDRRWLLIAGVAVLVVGVGLAVVGNAGDGDNQASVATRVTTSTTTTTLPAEASSTSVAVTSTASLTTAPRMPTAAPPTAAAPTCPRPVRGSDFDGFGAAEIDIRDARGTHRSCVLTADTSGQQARGLMGQDDLDGYAGMLFRFAKEEEQAFWMRNTSIPLSIAFFAADGAFVSAADMEPCGDRDDCPVYRSGGAAKFALEVPKGRLPAAGATPGSRLIG
jgi:uncharacterized membrane protein (UPF0127 family)